MVMEQGPPRVVSQYLNPAYTVYTEYIYRSALHICQVYRDAFYEQL